VTRRFLVRGRVQGVGFRYFVERQAARLSISGWVRNTAEGHVETVAAGAEEILGAFEAELRRGPQLSVVESVSVEVVQDPRVSGFEVRR
jgi:acylphosphatase